MGRWKVGTGKKKKKENGRRKVKGKTFFHPLFFCCCCCCCPFRLTPRPTNLPRVSYVAYTCRLLYLFPSFKMEQKNEVGVACKQAGGRTFSMEVFHKPDVSFLTTRSPESKVKAHSTSSSRQNQTTVRIVQ